MTKKRTKGVYVDKLTCQLKEARENCQTLSQMYERSQPNLSDGYAQLVCELDTMLDFISDLKQGV